ncbi:MAG: 2-phosphosulfolactate phosphatase [Bacteroidetes bacterium]|nr:2-phosphosulfolactate phosphatase [Bacteroidota bacterium]
MKINVLLSPHNVDELYFSKKTTVVIDVLRATTVIITALENGAREVIPVISVDFAMKVSGNAFGGQTLLGGERNTTKIEGFNLGNSPSEYNSETVIGKSIILYTSNGSKAIVKAKFSENLFICSFKNLKAVAAHLAKLNNDIEILCAGSNGMFCIEDTVCAGKLINEICDVSNDVELTDAAKASVVLNDSSGDSIFEMLKKSEHGQKLISNGFEDDLNECAEFSVSDVIPFYYSGVIKIFKEEDNEFKPE